MEWQPIETAPKDGTEFQAWVLSGAAGGSIGFWEPKCRYNEHGQIGFWGRIDYDIDGWDYGLTHLMATHWKPQPEPPK